MCTLFESKMQIKWKSLVSHFRGGKRSVFRLLENDRLDVRLWDYFIGEEKTISK